MNIMEKAMIKLKEPYKKRPIRFLGLWNELGWRLKVYGIAYKRALPRKEKGANTSFYWNKPFDILFEMGQTGKWGERGVSNPQPLDSTPVNRSIPRHAETYLRWSQSGLLKI